MSNKTKLTLKQKIMRNQKISPDEQFIINIICGPITGVMYIFSMFVFPSMLLTIFVLVLSISVGYSLTHIWRPVVNPFTPEEWKIIGRKTMEEEGILSSKKIITNF
jgi:hypothetical protein